jgi:hypothetical protein
MRILKIQQCVYLICPALYSWGYTPHDPMLFSLNAQDLGLHVRTAQEHRFILIIPKRFAGVWDKKVYNGMLAYDRTPELANGGN